MLIIILGGSSNTCRGSRGDVGDENASADRAGGQQRTERGAGIPTISVILSKYKEAPAFLNNKRMNNMDEICGGWRKHAWNVK